MPNREKIKNKKIVFAWLRKGEDDLSFAKMAFKETNFYDHVCYLSQQAVEKYLKALVVIQQGEITKKEKTHNLLYLSQLCKKTINLGNFRKDLRILSEVYIPTRYPTDGYIKASREEAKHCLEIAEKIIDFIKDKIDLSIYYQ